MILQQFDVFMPQQSLKDLRRSIVKSKRNLRSLMRRQYYVSSAIADTKAAFFKNEDIILAALLIIAVISFSAVSILANAIYTFVLAGSILSVLLNANLAALVILAMAVIGVLLIWVLAVLQNLISLSFFEGAANKRHRSLRKTLRNSLRYASRTTMAWVILALAIAGPVGTALITTVLSTHAIGLKPAAALPYVIAVSVIGLFASVWVAASYSLLPFVCLHEPFTDWLIAWQRSRQLTFRRGRLFVLSGYGLLLTALAGAYEAGQAVQMAIHFNPTITFMLLGMAVLTACNAITTSFYRKRKFARS